MEELVVRLVFQNSCCWREQLSGWRAFPLIDLVSGDGQVGKQELVVNKNLYCCKSFSLGNRAFCSWSPIVGSVWTRVFIDRPEDGGRDRGLPSREPNTCGALRDIHQGKNCYDNLCSCYLESSRNLHRTNIYCQTIEIDLTRLLVL